MRNLIYVALVGLGACNSEMMSPLSAEAGSVAVVRDTVTTEQLEVAGDSIDAELERQGLYAPMTDACAETFGFWAEEFVMDKREYPTAKRLVDAWADVESEGDPEVACLLAVD